VSLDETTEYAGNCTSGCFTGFQRFTYCWLNQIAVKETLKTIKFGRLLAGNQQVAEFCSFILLWKILTFLKFTTQKKSASIL